MKFIFFILFLNLLWTPVAWAEESPDWERMPQGGKSAYLGIHGGTMPISLLVSGDGETLLTFVGRTGNDFLNVLRQVKLPFPSFGNATGSGQQNIALERAKTGLFAGNATTSLPVISISGELLHRQPQFENLEPFGFSSTPLSIEGPVSKPAFQPPKKKTTLFFFPQSFRLNRN